MAQGWDGASIRIRRQLLAGILEAWFVRRHVVDTDEQEPVQAARLPELAWTVAARWPGEVLVEEAGAAMSSQVGRQVAQR